MIHFMSSSAAQGITAVALALASMSAAHAGPFSIGNASPTSAFLVQGQSFTPAVQGNAGSGAVPASGTVLLDSFNIAYLDPSAGFADLYIYAGLPTTAAAATGAGALGVGSYLGGGLYDFADLALDVNTTYYAILPAPATIFDGSGNPYAGGVDVFDRNPTDGQLDLGFGDFDIGFRAAFNTVPLPGTATLTLAALALLAAARRRAR